MARCITRRHSRSICRIVTNFCAERSLPLTPVPKGGMVFRPNPGTPKEVAMGQQPNLFAQEYVDAAQAIRDALTRDITDLLDPAKFSGKPALTPEDPALEALRRNVVDVKIKLTIAHVNADYGEMRRIADDAVRDWCHD